VLVITIINLLFKNEVSDGMANIHFVDTMLESSLVKLNVIFKHLINLISFFFIVNR
jgi:uncharacterized membrane protein